MGMFSFKTADDKISIPEGSAPVYLLMPDGKPNIREPSYSGYGMFGGVDVFTWLAQANVDKEILEGMSEEKVRTLGIGLSVGDLYKHVETGRLWSIFQNYRALNKEATHFEGNFGAVMPEYGKSPNDLIEEGLLEEVPLSSLCKYPVKLSYNPNAVYEEIENGSENCPSQGFMYSNKARLEITNYIQNHPEFSSTSTASEIDKAERDKFVFGGTPFRLQIASDQVTSEGMFKGEHEKEFSALFAQEDIVLQGYEWYPGASLDTIALPSESKITSNIDKDYLMELITYGINEGPDLHQTYFILKREFEGLEKEEELDAILVDSSDILEGFEDKYMEFHVVAFNSLSDNEFHVLNETEKRFIESTGITQLDAVEEPGLRF